MSKNATPNDEMNELHGQLAKTLKEQIQELSAAEDKKGLAAILNVSRQFLKDNGIESKITSDNPLGNLVKNLPFPDEQESTHH